MPMTAYVEAPPERIAALIYLISFVRGLALFTTLFALPIAYLIVQLLGSTCSLRGGFSMSAGISAQRDTILKDFPWYYYVNSDTREWWIAFYDKLRKRMQRRILELMIQNRGVAIELDRWFVESNILAESVSAALLDI